MNHLLENLKADYEEARTSHNAHVSDVEKWHKNFNGELTFTPKIARSRVVPKVIRKQAEWRYTALSEPFLSTEDLFDTEPVTFEDKAQAEQNKLVLNNQMNNKIDKIGFIDEYVRTAVDEGTVIIKVGWVSEKGSYTKRLATFDYLPAETKEEVQKLQQIEEENHKLMRFKPLEFDKLPAEVRNAHKLFMETGQPYHIVHTGWKTEKVDRLVKNHPTVEVCAYDKVILDPTCLGNIEEASFIIYEFEASLSKLQKDGRYKNLDKIKLKETDIFSNDDDKISEFKFKDKPRQKLTVFEYWGFYDINGNGIVEPFVSSWIGDTKIRMAHNPFPDKKLPFIKVQYLPVARENYGKPDGYLLEDNQHIVGAITRGMIDMMGRSAAGQQGVRKDALDVTNSRKFENGEDYKFNSNIDPRQAFQMGTFPEIPNSAIELINLQNLEAESLTGVKSFSQGISGQALGSTATAVRGALDAASKRELGILRRLADGIVQLGQKMTSMNSEFLEEEEVIRITNEKFVTVRRDDLSGQIDVRLSISTAEADNEKAQELAFMLQTGAATSDPGEVRMIRSEIARLRNMPALAKRIEEYQPKPDPVEEKRKELEIALLEAQVFNEQAKGKENTVDVDLKSAKTETEKAKARQLGSTSDKQDLDFLEQSQGIQHERALDKQENKARSDANLKAVEASLAPKKGGETSPLKNFNL